MGKLSWHSCRQDSKLMAMDALPTDSYAPVKGICVGDVVMNGYVGAVIGVEKCR